eukprot:TRINITY_DN11203_c0_g1_i3.p2 TRINITY_DN11203_c0_g1~~TRINITY_DN11203_c0_g1_i3.p2  ORF type:complete len:148 (+),score=15.82 TRINITY_DN11203_c0_g1_i3:238-681(+)
MIWPTFVRAEWVTQLRNGTSEGTYRGRRAPTPARKRQERRYDVIRLPRGSFVSIGSPERFDYHALSPTLPGPEEGVPAKRSRSMASKSKVTPSFYWPDGGHMHLNDFADPVTRTAFDASAAVHLRQDAVKVHDYVKSRNHAGGGWMR